MSPYNTKLIPEGEYCGYLRKSRADLDAEARGEGDTYERHERTLFDLAKRNGINLTKIYREKPISGERIESRPEMIQLLDDVEAGFWKGVLVVEVERLARGDTMDQGVVAQAFKYTSTLIITPNRTYDPDNADDEEYFEFGLFMSRREFKTINRRLQGGRIASIEDGKYLGNLPPYGYERVELKKGFTLEPHPGQSHVVQLIFSLYTDPDPKKRLGSTSIARKLNSLAIPPQKGGKWGTVSVLGILSNPVHTGIIRWGSRPIVKRRGGKSRPERAPGDYMQIEGLHPALVSKEIYDLAQVIMADNTRPFSRTGKLANPLAGLIKCDMCGNSIFLRKNGTRNPPSLICTTFDCHNVGSYYQIVEDRLLEGLQEWLAAYKEQWIGSKPNVIAEDDRRIKAYDKMLTTLNKSLMDLNEQMLNVHDLLEKKVYTTEVFMSRMQIVTQKIKETNIAIKHTEQEMNKEKKAVVAKKETIPMIENVLNEYRQAQSPEDKNILLRSILERITYRKEVGGRWKGAEDKFTLTLHPRLHKG